MTIDELRARKRELLARKKYELDLQARGEGDNLALFMVNEELLDVNDQLKALTVGRRDCGPPTLDGEIDEGRARLTAAAVHGLELLTPRQRELLELYLSGRNIPQIAGDLGVNKSTVSRSIALAKKKLREETERAMTEAKLRGDSARVDLMDPRALRAVMLAMTPKQTVSTLLGGQDAILEHPEALDELAYQAYCELDLHPEFVPEGVQMPQAAAPRKRREQKGPSRVPAMADISVLVRGRYSRKKRKPPGKLLSALLTRREDPAKGSMFQWLEAVFAAFLGRLRKHK